MRILFVGNTSLQNDAIIKILVSHDDWEVVKYNLEDITKNPSSFKEDPFTLTLVDLYSLDGDGKEEIRKLREQNIADYLLVIHNGVKDGLLDEVLEAGADDCLSINADTDSFLQTLSSYKNK